MFSQKKYVQYETEGCLETVVGTPTLSFADFPLLEDGGKNVRMVKRLVDWDLDSLIRKAKAALASKTKGGIEILIPLRRQMSSHFSGNRASACPMVTWEDKCHNHRCPLFLLLSQSFHCWLWRRLIQNIPLVTLGHLSWLHPVWTFGHHQPGDIEGWDICGERASVLCKPWSTAAKTLVC